MTTGTNEIRIGRDKNGWNAETNFDLNDRLVLKLQTSKRFGGGLRTAATVWKKDEGGFMSHAMGFGTGSGDFSETPVISQPARITENVVMAQHQLVLRHIDVILARAERFYFGQDAVPA